MVTEQYAKETKGNLQFAYEIARRNLKKRADKQKASNDRLKPYPVFKPGQQVLLYWPYNETDGPNPKLVLPWRGPYEVVKQLSPVVYKVKLSGESKETSVHLAHLKKFYPRERPPEPEFTRLDEFFLGKKLPLPQDDRSNVTKPTISSYVVDQVVGHRRGPGRKSHENYKYRLRLQGYGPSADVEYRAEEIPQCQHLINAYRKQHKLNYTRPPKSPSRQTRKKQVKFYGEPQNLFRVL